MRSVVVKLIQYVDAITMLTASKINSKTNNGRN
jgi:hypothetical protein